MTEPSKLPHHGVPEHQPAAGGIAARARAAAGPQYLNGLNPEQREAVETLDGPVLVLAGAGTGKTRVLTTRIAHILSQGRARPQEILSVTFTNKAAREMKLRLGQMLGQAVEGMPWLGTFHSIGGRILRIHAELVQLKSNFTVLDVDDQVRLLKQLLQAENIDDKRWPARMLAGLIDSWKNRGLSPSQVPAGEAASFGNGKGGKIYATYQERLKILNAADFGDLLLENIRLFRENPDVLRQYQSRFKFILVDEYQDTNRLQASSRIGLLVCLPMLSTLRHAWYAWAGIALASMSSAITWRVAGPILAASRRKYSLVHNPRVSPMFAGMWSVSVTYTPRARASWWVATRCPASKTARLSPVIRTSTVRPTSWLGTE